MNFLKPALLLLAGLLPLVSSVAADSPVASDPAGAWSVTPSVTSQYFFRGVRVSGACFQPSVDYAAGAFAAGVWSSVGFEDQVSGDSDPEVDFYASYTIPGSSETWSIVPGINVYTYPEAKRENGYYGATFEPSLAANVTAGGILFTPKIYYDLTLEGATYELTAAFALPLQALGTELAFSASAGTFKWNSVTADAAPKEKNWGDYWLLTVSVPVTISARSSIELAVTYSEGRNNFFKQAGLPKVENEDAVGRAAVTLSYTLTL